MSQTPDSGEPLTEIDMASVIRADLEAEYWAAIERDFQRLFLGDVADWHPTGLAGLLGGGDDD